MADDPQMDHVLRAALRRRPGAADADAADGVCLDAETFAAWSSGALSETEGQAIERHLSTCARCQEMAAIFVESEPPVSTATLVAFKPRWSFRWIGPIAAAAAAGVTWLVWPVRPQTLPPKEETTLSRVEPAPKLADAPVSAPAAPPAPVGSSSASTPSAPAPKLERVAPSDEAKRLAQAREAPAGAQQKNQDKDARDRRLDSRGATLADAQAASRARPVPSETRADPKLTAAPIQPPAVTAPTPQPMPAPTPAPPLPPATPPPAAGTVAGGMGQGTGQGAGVGAARGAATGPPPPPATAPPAGVVGGVVGGVPARAEEVQVRQQPAFRATLDGVAPVVVAEFSSGAGFAESVVGVAGGGGGGRAAGRGGAGGRGGGGAAAAPAANVLPTVTPRWRILLSGGVERSVDGGTSWQLLAIDPPVHVIAGTSPTPTTCWLIGRGGVVLVSTDGVRFARVPFQPATELTAIRATSARDATVTTADKREFVTNDGGATWRGRE